MKKWAVMGMMLMGIAAYSQEKLVDMTRALYADLNRGDSAGVSKFFSAEAYVVHVGKDTTFSFDLPGFLGVCPKFKSGLYAETLGKIEVKRVSPLIATVDVGFNFFYDGVFSHCGVDHYTWIKQDGQYLVQSVLSTDVINCEKTRAVGVAEYTELVLSVNGLMDQWHRDVAEIKLDSYFDFMSESFYFLGTDPTERWSKADFRKFCEPYFLEKRSTWDFKPKHRNWDFSDDYEIAWFDESLDTWMEECRGSGVLKKIDGEWKIVHYNLTVLIENDKIQKFIKLRKK